MIHPQLSQRLDSAKRVAACPACGNIAVQYPVVIRGTDKIDWQCQSCGSGHSAIAIERATSVVRGARITLARTIRELRAR